MHAASPLHDSAADTALAQRYADALCASLALPRLAGRETLNEHPAEAWARSGLMALSGGDDAQLCIAPAASAAQAVLAVLAAQASPGDLARLDAAALLGERAALMGTTRLGAVSPGGACHLLATADGWLAVNLARDDDWTLLPAWLECDGLVDLDTLTRALRSRRSDEWLQRARWLGLAVAREQPPTAAPWCQIVAGQPWQGGRKAPRRRPRVVDLSSLWAGPLCSHLLLQLGAEVIKVEGWARPDGARRGNARFFDLLHAGKRCVAVDWGSADGIRQLRALLESADIVIEGSRPRALQQLGIDAEARVATQPGLTWVSLTGYGRRPPEAEWVAFGDDASVAAGLSWLMREQTGRSLMVGDALADPLTGLHAALAAWTSWNDGGGRLLSLSLVDTLRHVACFELPTTAQGRHARHADWAARLEARSTPVAPPTARPATAAAAALGADNAALINRPDRRC